MVSATRIASDTSDVIVGRWADGRLGSVRVLPETRRYGAVVFRPEEVVQSQPGMSTAYTPMLRAMVGFFRSGEPPVPHEVTLEIFAFMDAALKSRQRDGATVRLEPTP